MEIPVTAWVFWNFVAIRFAVIYLRWHKLYESYMKNVQHTFHELLHVRPGPKFSKFPSKTLGRFHILGSNLRKKES